MFFGVFLLMKFLFFLLVFYFVLVLLFILSGCFYWFFMIFWDFCDLVIIMKLGEYLLFFCNKCFFLLSYKCNRLVFMGFMLFFIYLGYWKNNFKYLLIKSYVVSDYFFKILLFFLKFWVSLWCLKIVRLWYIYLEKVFYY